MASIVFVIPPVDENVFSGGMLCLFEYAKGLRARGHDLALVPLLPSKRPKWFSGDFGWLTPELLEWESPLNVANTKLIELPLEIHSGLYLLYVREILQNRLSRADITVATACTTALPVNLYGSGRKFYFAQHFEPYFGGETQNAPWWEHQARATYDLPLQIIANSSWLKDKLYRELGKKALLCPNAIDHAIFHGAPKTSELRNEVNVISYGGRTAQWKGFREMAEGVHLARLRLPDVTVNWQVYGSSLIPPENAVAPYKSLGFLNSHQLAEAYRRADILLSASWYESFPLFPLEAMACGLPAITTQSGTEDFAIPEVTAEVIEPRDPESVAEALVRLTTRDAYRVAIARRGWEACKRFNWEASVDRMEQILCQ